MLVLVLMMLLIALIEYEESNNHHGDVLDYEGPLSKEREPRRFHHYGAGW